MSNKTLPTRIPFESMEEKFSSWNIPAVEGPLASPKKKPPAKRPLTKQEKIEDVTGNVDVKPITAGQLQDLTEELEKEAFEKGYQEGFEKGQKDGEARGLAEGKQQAYQQHSAVLEEQKARLASILEQLFQPLELQDVLLENIVLDMAVGFAQHLMGAALDANPSLIFPIVTKAVNALPAGAKNIRIYLHGDDMEIVKEIAQDEGKTWNVYADNAMERGGCRVETEESLVDYSIKSQLDTFFAESAERTIHDDDIEDVEPYDQYYGKYVEQYESSHQDTTQIDEAELSESDDTESESEVESESQFLSESEFESERKPGSDPEITSETRDCEDEVIHVAEQSQLEDTFQEKNDKEKDEGQDT